MVGERLNPIERPYKRELFYLLQTQRFYNKPYPIDETKLHSFIKTWKPRHYEGLNSVQDSAIGCFSLANDLSRCLGIPAFLDQEAPHSNYSYEDTSLPNRIVVAQAFKLIEEVYWFVKIVNGEKTYILQPQKDTPLQLQDFKTFCEKNSFLSSIPIPTTLVAS